MDISGIKDKIDLVEGQWVDAIPGLPGVALQVRSAHFKGYTRARDKALREEAPDTASVEGEDAFWSITGAKMAEHLVTGWKGVTDGGEAVEFSPQAVLALLTADDPHGIGERFRRGVDWASSQVAARLAKRTEALSGN